MIIEILHIDTSTRKQKHTYKFYITKYKLTIKNYSFFCYFRFLILDQKEIIE